jgi:GTP-binding protein Era
MNSKCGYVAILGRPNAGKSTLLNALVGEKLAVVSRKPQTTRNRILGVSIEGKAQILFLDTPGIHKKHGAKSLINQSMNQLALQVARDADLIIYLVDAAEGVVSEDKEHIAQILATTRVPIAFLVSKTDKIRYDDVRSAVQQLIVAVDDALIKTGESPDRLIDLDTATISAKRPDEVKALKKQVAQGLPESAWMFDEDDLTDMPGSFLVAEIIREQVFRQCGQEIPYSCAVRIDQIDEDVSLVRVHAAVVVSHDRHKPMILGKGGQKIREIGTEARLSLERYFDKKVFLDLRVKTLAGWTDDKRMIAELAHIQDLEGLIDPAGLQ